MSIASKDYSAQVRMEKASSQMLDALRQARDYLDGKTMLLRPVQFAVEDAIKAAEPVS